MFFLFLLYLWTRVGRQITLYFLTKINLMTFNKSNCIHLKKTYIKKTFCSEFIKITFFFLAKVNNSTVNG